MRHVLRLAQRRRSPHCVGRASRPGDHLLPPRYGSAATPRRHTRRPQRLGHLPTQRTHPDPAGDQSQQARTADALAGPLDATNWIGTSADTRSLQQLWDTTDQAGHIHQRGLYVNEHNRLSRVTAAGNTDTGTAKREIDTFITDIANEHAADEPYRDQVVAYARRVPSTFGP